MYKYCFILIFNFIIYCFAHKQPNILFIVADDLGWNDVGYHQSEIETPFIDKLSAKGVRLNNYYVQPICTPTRNCFMTGRYPIRTGLQHDVIHPAVPAGLPLNERLLPQALKEVGYETHILGKWHLGFYKKEFTPLFRGFDSHYGYYLGAEDYYNHTRKFNKKYIGYDWRRNLDIDWSAKNKYSTHLLVDEVEKIIINNVKGNPLYMYLSFQSVHDPLEVPDEYLKKYDFITDKKRKIYAGMVSCLDEAIKNVSLIFKKYDLLNNTIIIWTSDNGGPVPIHNNWPLRGGKNSLWEGGLRVPSFIYSKLLNKNIVGKENNELIHAIDWYPTIIKLANASLEQELPIDGIDIWEAINDNKKLKRKEILLDFDPVINMSAIRYCNWKLVLGNPCINKINCGWYPPPKNQKLQYNFLNCNSTVYSNNNKSVWLFNIKEDPNECHNLYNVYPKIVNYLTKRINWYSKQQAKVQIHKNDPEANPAKHNNTWTWWK